jgi:hypothetical protein
MLTYTVRPVAGAEKNIGGRPFAALRVTGWVRETSPTGGS